MKRFAAIAFGINEIDRTKARCVVE